MFSVPLLLRFWKKVEHLRQLHSRGERWKPRTWEHPRGEIRVETSYEVYLTQYVECGENTRKRYEIIYTAELILKKQSFREKWNCRCLYLDCRMMRKLKRSMHRTADGQEKNITAFWKRWLRMEERWASRITKRSFSWCIRRHFLREMWKPHALRHLLGWLCHQSSHWPKRLTTSPSRTLKHAVEISPNRD